MKARWQQLAARFDGLARRERALVAAASIGGVLLIGNSLLIDPLLARNRSLRLSIERQGGELATLEAQASALEAQLQVDPNAGKKTEVSSLKEAVRQADEQLAKLETGLVPPERMNLVLESLLHRHPGLRVVSLKTLAPAGLLDRPAEPVADKAASKAAIPVQAFNFFRHGVEIQLEGSYPDLQSYVVQLEQGAQKFLWGEMRLAVPEYPKCRLTLVVYTLSSDKTWLAI